MSVNTLGNSFVISGNAVTSSAPVNRFSAGSFGVSGFPEVVDPTNSTASAVDLSNNDLYIDIANEILRYDVNGNLLESFGSGGTLAESAGVAVNPTNQLVYATNRVANTVKIFNTIVTPDATTGAAQASQETATVNGAIEHRRRRQRHQLQIRIRPQQQTLFEHDPVQSGRGGHPVHRTDAGDGEPFGSQQGDAVSLPRHRDQRERNDQRLRQNLHHPQRRRREHRSGELDHENRRDAERILHRQRRPDDLLLRMGPDRLAVRQQNRDAPGRPGAIEHRACRTDGPDHRALPSGPSSTPYHYRVAAVNSAGTTFGPDRTFLTKPVDPPTVQEVESLDVATDSAEIGAQINPNGADTIYLVEYGLQSVYDSAT